MPRTTSAKPGAKPGQRGRAAPSGPYATNHFFRRLASATAHGVGSPWSFVVACAVVVGWAITGPLFGFSDTWQLIINTSTTIVTFLMVFLIQNTQNRDSHALHLKLDELIRATDAARNQFISAEDFTDDELRELRAEFEVLAHQKLARRSVSSHASRVGVRLVAEPFDAGPPRDAPPDAAPRGARRRR